MDSCHNRKQAIRGKFREGCRVNTMNYKKSTQTGSIKGLGMPLMKINTQRRSHCHSPLKRTKIHLSSPIRATPSSLSLSSLWFTCKIIISILLGYEVASGMGNSNVAVHKIAWECPTPDDVNTVRWFRFRSYLKDVTGCVTPSIYPA